MYIFKGLFAMLFLTNVVGYNFCNRPIISRKDLIKIVGLNIATNALICNKPVLAYTDDNPPLTEAEMEEYKKLLKDAERIKSIIDANKKAFIREETEIKKNLDKNDNKTPIKIENKTLS